jgi:hypothetical protein
LSRLVSTSYAGHSINTSLSKFNIEKMAPAHSKLNDTFQVADCLTHHMASNPPPIKLMRSERASKSPSDTMFHEFEYRLDSADKKSAKISKKS